MLPLGSVAHFGKFLAGRMAMHETGSNYRKVGQAGIASWVRDSKDGRIEIAAMDDLGTLIKLDIELQGDDKRQTDSRQYRLSQRLS
jgi:hypothetical protein